MQTLQGKTILIADDESDLREILAMAFRQQGCHIIEAGSGGEAIQILRQDSVDAVVSDVRMPGGDGIDLLMNLRGLDGTPPHLILMSGCSDLTEQGARDLGAYRMLFKPFRLSELVEIVRDAISSEPAADSPCDSP